MVLRRGKHGHSPPLPPDQRPVTQKGPETQRDVMASQPRIQASTELRFQNIIGGKSPFYSWGTQGRPDCWRGAGGVRGEGPTISVWPGPCNLIVRCGPECVALGWGPLYYSLFVFSSSSVTRDMSFPPQGLGACCLPCLEHASPQRSRLQLNCHLLRSAPPPSWLSASHPNTHTNPTNSGSRTLPMHRTEEDRMRVHHGSDPQGLPSLPAPWASWRRPSLQATSRVAVIIMVDIG